VPHRIDAGMKAMQAASLDSTFNRAFPESHRQELRPRHHPVLSGCERRDPLLAPPKPL